MMLIWKMVQWQPVGRYEEEKEVEEEEEETAVRRARTQTHTGRHMAEDKRHFDTLFCAHSNNRKTIF